MKELYFGELRRFRNAALIFAVAHQLLQILAYRMADLLRQSWQVHAVVLGAYMLGGLGFALYQFGSYRQPSRWVWLLHRPLSRAAIFGAIALASGTLILFAVGLPVLLTLLGIEQLTGAVVDARHYLALPHILLFTLIAWLAGACVILNRSRSAIVMLVLPFLMLAHPASGWVMLAPALLCLALFAFIAYGSFKPDRLAAPRDAATLVLTAAPLQLGMFIALVWIGSALFQVGSMMAGVHPLSQAVPPPGGYVELTRATGGEAFASGLAGSGDARAPQWRRQLALTKVETVRPVFRQFPVRHQLSNMGTIRFTDTGRQEEWTFSHDAMRWHGRDAFTGAHRGWIGLNGFGDTRPFPAVPRLAGGFLLPHQVVHFDPERRQSTQLVSLAAPETAVAPLKAVGERLYLLTNLRLVAYRKPAPDEPGALAQAFSVALPGPFSDLDRIDIAPLLDGTLLSFNYGRNMVTGGAASQQVVMLADAAGKAQVVQRRAVAHDFPVLFEQRDWWPSPVLHALVNLPDQLLDNGLVPDQVNPGQASALPRARPPLAWAAALLSSLLAAAGAWAWLRRARIGARRKAGWIAACLLLGLPSVLALMVLQPRAPRAQRAMSGNPQPLALQASP